MFLCCRSREFYVFFISCDLSLRTREDQTRSRMPAASAREELRAPRHTYDRCVFRVFLFASFFPWKIWIPIACVYIPQGKLLFPLLQFFLGLSSFVVFFVSWLFPPCSIFAVEAPSFPRRQRSIVQSTSLPQILKLFTWRCHHVGYAVASSPSLCCSFVFRALLL